MKRHPAYIIDRTDVVTLPEGEFHRLRAVRRVGNKVQVARHGKYSPSSAEPEVLLAGDLPHEVVELSPGQLLIPIDVAPHRL